MKAVLTDIEGTTTSIAFVKDVLFPYARRRLPTFVREHAARPDIAAILDDTRALANTEARDTLDTEAVIALLLAWIDEDRKATPLKTLQGILWAEGYAQSQYRGHVYPDVAPALRRWHTAGVSLWVYSSGSVAAQKLLFGHSEAGDLTPLFSGYFDTLTGAKQSVDSYRAMASAIGDDPPSILFLSDVAGELNAARAAGFATAQLCREGTAPAGNHVAAISFDALDKLVFASTIR